MINWISIFGPVALLLPAMLGGEGEGRVESGQSPGKATLAAGAEDSWSAFRPWSVERLPQQVRIEQRVVIRISPARARAGSIDDLPLSIPPRVVERGMSKCVGMRDIVAVQTGSDNRLILFMRSREMISARLEKACAARDFYSGFYVEPSKDGRLCIKRDALQSRNGTKCEVAKFYRLEATRD